MAEMLRFPLPEIYAFLPYLPPGVKRKKRRLRFKSPPTFRCQAHPGISLGYKLYSIVKILAQSFTDVNLLFASANTSYLPCWTRGFSRFPSHTSCVPHPGQYLQAAITGYLQIPHRSGVNASTASRACSASKIALCSVLPAC